MIYVMPALRHHFGLTWSEIESMPEFELDELLECLPDLPPVGAVLMASLKS